MEEDDILAVGVCRLCGTGPETNWHVHAKCTHPAVVDARRVVSTHIMDSIEGLGLVKGASQLLKTNWILDGDGTAYDLEDVEGIEDATREWAPDIADRAEEIQNVLHWHCKQGAFKDDLRKWAFRGIMLDHWVTALG